MLTYELDRTIREPLYVQLYNFIRMDIESGVLTAGSKLPSKRSFAQHLGISLITVENSYSQLLAEGYIRSEVKKGYYVEKIEKKMETSEIFEPEETENEMLEDSDNKLFPFTIWAKIMRDELSENQTKLLTKPPFEGVYELRKAISEHLRNFRNIQASPNQIIIGAGTEYLYMLINILFGSNYIFGLEDPGYSKIANIYNEYNIKCEYIPMMEDGMDVDYLKKNKVDIIHISPSHHFPTGAVTSIGKRYALLEWASKSPDRYIIEDDYDSEFRLSGKPISSLYGIDVIDKVIYMNTFSKSLASTIRISYMVLPKSLMKRFHERLGFFSCPVSTFEQHTLARFISEGYFERHINRMRRHYKKRKEELFEDMKKYDIFENSVISGENSGLHCVVKFDTQKTDEELLEEVVSYGFKASMMKDYYFINREDTHTLVFYY
ncbi:MAG: PLP-dependent aminotransferase family protein [Oscillospiraceae bacterium]|nr:PLP-dependent aminotransferase family protein [Oscillospiraceae bacterium]MDD6086151.1 PLP-dependent aminotransferase family protein [Oscillospiraceae bacterium]